MSGGRVPRLRGSPARALWLLRWLPAALLVAAWPFGPARVETDARIRALASPAAFRLLDWETVNVATRLGRIVGGLARAPGPSPAEREALAAYFGARDEATRARWRTATEVGIERAVAAVAAAEGASAAPVPGLFPPVLAALTPPPNVLVVSPRTELRITQSVLLKPLSTAEQEELERSADSSGVSSLVAPIGGIATYPAMVVEGDQPLQTVTSVAHEWVHHYLAFFPLGGSYWGSQPAREVNETTADLVSREIGQRAAQDLGLAPRQPPAPQPLAPQPPLPPAAPAPAPVPAPFDFRAFMRETRLEVERLLAAGAVEPAEAYMRARRDDLQARGYAIRKLNQAYFAFYGSYGEGFAASPRNPVPDLLRRLRARSPSLGAFLRQVRDITSIEDLRAAAGP